MRVRRCPWHAKGVTTVPVFVVTPPHGKHLSHGLASALVRRVVMIVSAGLFVAILAGCGGSSGHRQLQPQRELLDRIVRCLEDAGLQTQPVGLSTNFHIVLQLTDQVFINTQQYPARTGTLTPEQAFQQIPHHEVIKTCAAA
jgi:hypothetical protein